MVALDHSPQYDSPSRPAPQATTALAIAALALAVFVTGFALRGFTDNGLRFGTQLVWRFNCVVFFAALVTAPLGRMVPAMQALAGATRPLLQGFCAAMAVYFASLLLPNLLAVPDGIRPAGITAGMTVFTFFTGSVTLVMAAAANRSLCERVGPTACRTMLGVSAIFFWLCYSLIGLAHISGPHRPDSFYELSVILMVLALLVRFGERFVGSVKRSVPAR
jgi:hypothetical protein